MSISISTLTALRDLLLSGEVVSQIEQLGLLLECGQTLVQPRDHARDAREVGSSVPLDLPGEAAQPTSLLRREPDAFTLANRVSRSMHAACYGSALRAPAALVKGTVQTRETPAFSKIAAIFAAAEPHFDRSALSGIAADQLADPDRPAGRLHRRL